MIFLAPSPATISLPADAILAPGFIDIQVNGGGGVLLNDEPTEEGVRQNLVELLTRLGQQIPLLSDKITQNYLTHVQASRQLATLENGGFP